MNETSRDEERSPDAGGYLPRLAVTEWLVFCGLAAALCVGNIYTTLLTGWGDGGSLIAVIAAVLFLGLLGRRNAGVQRLNLGQTIASAGGTAGFAISAYAAVKMADASFDAGPLQLCAMFLAMAMIGVVYGVTIRRSMIRYYFPSGTACAVILKSVSAAGDAARRSIHVLAFWGTASAALAVPTKITLEKGAGALLSAIPLGTVGAHKLALSVDPLLYGLGLVVGPAIGAGLLAGAVVAAFLVPPLLEHGGVPEAAQGDWTTWVAISLLVLPTFAGMLFARMFRTEPVVPGGFEPGKVSHRVPGSRNLLGVGILSVAVLVTAITGGMVFGLPWHLSLLAILLTWPLAVMNGRVTADTDINPVLLAVIVLLTLFTVSFGSSAILLLGIVIICQTLAGMAVDMMQDYRTGYLVDANPTHQTTVQVIGSFVGVLVGVPFILLLDSRLGFGPEAGLPAPGPRIYTGLAEALAGTGIDMSSGLVTTIVLVSLAGAGYSFFASWPRTKPWVPSLFGAGMGMLIGFEMSAAVFIGGLAKWVVGSLYRRRGNYQGDDAASSSARADADTTLVGSAVFAASALASVLVIVLAAIAARAGAEWFFLAM